MNNDRPVDHQIVSKLVKILHSHVRRTRLLFVDIQALRALVTRDGLAELAPIEQWEWFNRSFTCADGTPNRFPIGARVTLNDVTFYAVFTSEQAAELGVTDVPST